MATRKMTLRAAAAAALVGLAALLLLAAPARAEASDEWMEPVLVESLSSATSESAASSLAAAEAAHAALLAQTVTAEGKTEAEFRAEVEARSPKLFAEFKKAFKRDYGWPKPGALRSEKESGASRTFTTNLFAIGGLNEIFSSASIPVNQRVVFSHMVEYADMSQSYFEHYYLGAKLPLDRPLVRNFLEMDTTIGADADADADAEADAGADAEVEADAEAEVEAEAEAEAEVEAETEAEAEAEVDECKSKWGGRCISRSSCPKTDEYEHVEEVCKSATIVCCVETFVRPSQLPKPAPKPAPPAPPAAPPKDVDYRSIGTPIKDQGRCATAWAMTGISVIESAYNLKYKAKCPALSVQSVLDTFTNPLGFCDSPLTPEIALRGGGTQFRGTLHESDYPYVAKPSKAPSETIGPFQKKFKTPNPMVKKVEWVLPLCTSNSCTFDENAVGQALHKYGPLSAMIDASSMQFYKSGVIPYKGTRGSFCGNDRLKVNHAVVIEGIGTDKATGARWWIVRNSWGTGWGESGRMRMEFGKNLCSIAAWNQYVTF